MEKRNKIIYWIATIWLSFGMASSGFFQMIQFEEEVKNMGLLGYPPYFLSIIGVWKLLAVITILSPGLKLMKEWAYAGLFFTMSGAIVTHIAVADPLAKFFGATLFLILSIVSWYFRPANRKLALK